MKLLINLQQYVQIHSDTITANMGAEETFICTAAAALQRVSKRSSSELVQHWVLTSLEVSVDHDEGCVGQGSFGRIYRGDWNGQVCSIIFARFVWLRPVPGGCHQGDACRRCTYIGCQANKGNTHQL